MANKLLQKIQEMNILNFIKNSVFGKEVGTIPASNLSSVVKNPTEKELLRNFGVVNSELNLAMEEALFVASDRRTLYAEIEKSLSHPIMSAAIETYADYSTPMSTINNCTIWATATTEDYQYELDKLFEVLNLEEVIYDWATTAITYGDLFCKLNLQPGIGISSIEDSIHPLDVARIDLEGRLIGFIDVSHLTLKQSNKRELLQPYLYSHLRLLGAVKRRASDLLTGSSLSSEYRTMTMLLPNNRRVSSKYGTSILNNALSAYKRLKMSEDALLMARCSRGRIKNIYKIQIPKGTTPEAAAILVNEYAETLKRTRTIDTALGKFTESTNLLTDLDDIIVPVWGDANSVLVEKIGGEVDIRSIVDISELTKQLATALRIPLPILSGYTKEAPAALGNGSIPDLDLRFSKQCYRIQRAIKAHITRIAQIHLSAQGKSTDSNLFEIHMAETSTAAEQDIRDNLDKGIDVSKKLIEFLSDALGEDYNKLEVVNYLNEKILKLNDFELNKIVNQIPKTDIGPLTTPETNPFMESKKSRSNLSLYFSDLKADLPQVKQIKKLNESKNEIEIGYELSSDTWDSKYKNTIIEIESK